MMHSAFQNNFLFGNASKKNLDFVFDIDILKSLEWINLIYFYVKITLKILKNKSRNCDKHLFKKIKMRK